MANEKMNPVLHVIVVGFHHKKGCQVEYAYPPLIEGQPVDSHELPAEWKNLPSLALPDGAHNCDEDTVYFHLPSREDDKTTVYGVSCYRQIDAKEVLNKSSEVTRNTVQKCVCVLSRLPLFGVIEARLEMITYAWFREKDFTQVSLLEETYRQLGASCNNSLLEGSQVFLGLSCKDLVSAYKQEIVKLFKLILLERKVLVYGSPVKPVCTTLLALLSLFPDMVEFGLKESACSCPQRHLSSTLRKARANSMEDEDEDFLEVHYSDDLEKSKVKGHSSSSAATKHSIVKDCGATSADSSQTLSLESPSSSKGGRTPTGGIMEKSESEGLEKDTGDGLLGIGDPSDGDIGGVNGQAEVFENKGRVQGGETVDLEQRTGETELTNEGRTPIVEEGKGWLAEGDELKTKEISENLKEGDTLLLSSSCKDVSEENLASEGTASEFGTTSNMEDLLEAEETLEWGEDRLLLEIESELHTQTADGEEVSVRRAGVERGDSTNSWTSQASSVASDIGEASVKVMSGLKHRISSLWDSPPADVHQTNGHLVEESDTTSSPESSTSGSQKSTPSKSSQKTSPAKPASQQSPVQTTGPQGALTENSSMPDMGPSEVTSLSADECGFPIRIFTNGLICHPYLSLQYYELLQDVNTRGFLVGASNMLFKQKRHLIDVLIEVSDARIVYQDELLRRQLTLSTADLRFADHLVKCVSDAKGNVFLNETEWEGGDEWVRGQFKLYLASLLVTVQKGDEKLQEDFNPHFVEAYKTTNNYKLWTSSVNRGLKEAPPGHPFQGNLSVNDVKMRLAHTMQNSERGKKLMNAAGTTGKAIGGALTSVKSSVSTSVTGLFSSIRKWSASETPTDSG